MLKLGKLFNFWTFWDIDVGCNLEVFSNWTDHEDTKFQTVYELNENFQRVELKGEEDESYQIALANVKNHDQWYYCPMYGFVIMVRPGQEEISIHVSKILIESYLRFFHNFRV